MTKPPHEGVVGVRAEFIITEAHLKPDSAHFVDVWTPPRGTALLWSGHLS